MIQSVLCSAEEQSAGLEKDDCMREIWLELLHKILADHGASASLDEILPHINKGSLNDK